MKSKLFCSPEWQARVTSQIARAILTFAVLCSAAFVPKAFAGGDAPPWMHALVNAQLPTYDEKTDAVLLYSETNVTVLSLDKIRTQVREAYKMRPNGREHGAVFVAVNPARKIKAFHGWCIPAQGKDFEVRDKDASEVSPNVSGPELISDVKYKVLHTRPRSRKYRRLRI